MPKKQNPSIIPRLTGEAGRKKLLAALCTQQVVGGDTGLAKRLIKAGTLHEFAPGKTVMRQGDADNDIYMVISGSVGTVINKREIAVRGAGNHIGEMALLDPTARRSATIVTREETVLLKVPEARVTRIADSYPEFWRRLAVELGTRLRERTRFVAEPNPVPRVFVGSSSEALEEASYVSKALSRHDLACRVWSDGIFQLSQTAIEDLVRAASDFDFAVLLLTPDDMTSSRGRKNASPRDNVVFELGLFMGALGRDRTFLVLPKGSDLKLPTDLLGVTHALYERSRGRPIGKRFQQALRTLRQRIQVLGPK